jgi:hypothetical protein
MRPRSNSEPLLFTKAPAPTAGYALPDFAHIHQELTWHDEIIAMNRKYGNMGP